MRKRILFSMTLALVLCQLARAVTPPEGFKALFNGKDLSGWYGDNPHKSTKADDREQAIKDQQADFKKHWSIEGDELVNDGQGPYAVTQKDYGDIELTLEYKTVALADSGIYLRGSPQVQIWDTTEAGGKWKLNAQMGSGGLYNNPKGSPGKDPLVHADNDFGEWNAVRIKQIGSRTWVWLNEKLVVDGVIMHAFWDKTKPLPAKGPILLQTHGGEIRWRNIFIREINPNEANRTLREGERKTGFKSILNKDNLKNWTGDHAEKSVSKGVLHWNGGGHLYTSEQYDDFIFRFEFTMPENGNNGLAIRYPGEGNPAYDGMCELQIIDNRGSKYTELDSRQYHGSAYGITAAHKGYQRPYGKWNYQEVKVQGSQITVELNGTVILNTDVSEVTDYLQDKAHPGKNLETGYLGFAGHGKHAFKFRKVSIKELAP